MLLAGTGTGLAPLIAIAKDAIKQQHKGQITLIHGGSTENDLYYVEELTALADKYENFQYENCVLKSRTGFPEIPIDKKMLMHLKSSSTTQVYVCGPKETIQKLKTKAFLAGVPSSSILSDAFL